MATARKEEERQNKRRIGQLEGTGPVNNYRNWVELLRDYHPSAEQPDNWMENS